MSNLEYEELTQLASSMNKGERDIVLKSFPVEDLLESIRLRYEDMENKYKGIQKIINN